MSTLQTTHETTPERTPETTHESTLTSHIKRGELVAGMNFHQRVWAMTARIPAGRVTTYAAVAAALGSRGARAVGQALNRNPYAPAVPCHRVVGSDGRLTGFAGGLAKKRDLLAEEGVGFNAAGRVALADYAWDFK
ncbi:MGMT family protein [Phycisphaerales bacterium AB-hyl4]|uniref:MGMT family protein n=1 Tax=Natronomicrosphaera hydrolytica TaxID=3242702 RepID=A0ABV4U940_9BACT